MAMAMAAAVSPWQAVATLQSAATHVQGRRRGSAMRVWCMSESSSIKRGAVGPQRFKESAVPGMYWGDSEDLGEQVSVTFTAGSEMMTASARAGENLLRVAEQCGAMVVNADFCFEGACCHCEMEVLGGATEVGYRAEVKGGSLVRSCLCPVPGGRRDVEVNIINNEDGWDDMIV